MKLNYFIAAFKKKLLIFTPLSVIILLVVAFVVISVVKHQKIQVFTKLIKVEVTGESWKSNYNQFEGYRPPYWFIENLEVGAQELAADGRVIAKVVDIDYYERYGGNAQVFLYVELNTVDNFSFGSLIYKGKSIGIGEEISFSFKDIVVKGQVIDYLEDSSVPTKKPVLVKGTHKSVSNDVAAIMKVGDTITNPYNGKTVAKITSLKVLPSSKSIIYNNPKDSTVSFKTDYTVKDVEVEAVLYAEQHFGNYYYSGHQVLKVGENVSLFFPNFNIGGMEIIEVSDAK